MYILLLSSLGRCLCTAPSPASRWMPSSTIMKVEHMPAVLGLAQCGKMSGPGRMAIDHLPFSQVGMNPDLPPQFSTQDLSVLGHSDDPSNRNGFRTGPVPAEASAEELLLISLCWSHYADHLRGPSVSCTVT